MTRYRLRRSHLAHYGIRTRVRGLVAVRQGQMPELPRSLPPACHKVCGCASPVRSIKSPAPSLFCPPPSYRTSPASLHKTHHSHYSGCHIGRPHRDRSLREEEGRLPQATAPVLGPRKAARTSVTDVAGGVILQREALADTVQTSSSPWILSADPTLARRASV